MINDRDRVEDEAAEEAQGSRWIWWIVGIVAAVAAGVLLASTVWDNRWSGEDEIPAGAVASQTQASEMQGWCGTQSVYDDIRRELFKRAADVRGNDEEAFARLADFALLRINSPVARGIDDQLQSVSCNATAVLNLPPNVRTADGTNAIAGSVSYVVQQASDGSGKVVRLDDSDSMVIALATVSGVQAAPAPAPVDENSVDGNGVPGGEPVQLPQSTLPPAPQPQAAGPSFDCGQAGNGTEQAICNDPGLSALDRQMADSYRSALANADDDQRRLLERTRDRFLSFRNRCATSQCIAQTYRSRIREIGDIVTGRWHG